MSISYSPKRKFVFFSILLSLFLLILSFLHYVIGIQLVDANLDNPPKFIQFDIVDLSKIYSISKFRSGVGHDASANGEKCRSMRHIFGGPGTEDFATAEEKWEKIHTIPDPNNSIDVYSPVDGRLGLISGLNETKEGVGATMIIRPDNGYGYQIRIDSVFPDENIKSFERVHAGQKIASVCLDCPIEVLITYNYLGKLYYVSYFSVISDTVFAAYQERGIESRDELIISKEYRDAHPFRCADPNDDTSELLPPEVDDPIDGFVYLNGFEDIKQEDNKIDEFKKE